MIYQNEKRCLGIAVFVLFFQGIFILITGIFSDSNSLLIEAFKSISGFISSMILYRNIKLLYNPPDKKYNFGYYKIEPLVVFKQSSFLIAGSILAVFFALQDIVNEDKVKHETVIFTTIGISFLVYLFLTLYFYFVNRRIKSGVIKILLVKWIHGLVEYIGITIGFIIVHILENSQLTNYHFISAYIDPVMTILISIFTIYFPLRHYLTSYRDLMDINPGEAVTQKITEMIEKTIGNELQKDLKTTLKIRTAGEKTFLTIVLHFIPESSMAKTQELLLRLDSEINSELGDNVFTDYCLGKSV